MRTLILLAALALCIYGGNDPDGAERLLLQVASEVRSIIRVG